MNIVESQSKSSIVFVEPFYGGSHKQLIDTLTKEYFEEYDLVSLPAKKWPWRARCSSLVLSQLIPKKDSYKVLFCSCVVSLAELLGLRPDLHKLKKIVYFHENQLIYPKQEVKKRDFQFGFNQITTCLAADLVIFNSLYNFQSFLQNIKRFIKLMPDCRPKDLETQIKEKSTVLYFPIDFSLISTQSQKKYNTKALHIIWPHRWEFDKGPEDFFEVMILLKKHNVKFNLSVLGETFTDVPDIFHKAKELLHDEILHWGYIESKDEYYKVLKMGHVAVSTAKHEFYGVAILEAVYCGCFPLLPNRLVYPEIYSKACLYKDNMHLFNILHSFCDNLNIVEEKYKNLEFSAEKFSAANLVPQFKNILVP